MKRVLGLSTLLITLTGCSSGGSSFSILPTAQGFSQSTGTVNNKVDILWVIDNSSSMDPLQQNLTTNFNSFINQFISKGYDFHMAVTTSDAYLSGAFFNNDPTLSIFRDGAGSSHTSVFDILPSTLNLIPTFVTNATQGSLGSGDERSFSSFKAALQNNSNQGFLRSDSFLGVIILSDEDDFSDPTRPEASWQYNGGIADHAYNDPGLESVDSYVSYLDTKTATTGSTRRYSVSAITVLDNNCLQAHIGASSSTMIATRYMDIANKTNGILGSICDASYANSLLSIQQKIAELSTQFYLTRTPVQNTITVLVNGTNIVQDAVSGWTYNSASNSIIFHGASVPATGAAIQVDFSPTTLTF